MAFMDFINNKKKQEKKHQEELTAKYVSVTNEVFEVLNRRGINHYEMLDILGIMFRTIMGKTAEFMQNQHEAIIKYRDELNKFKAQTDDTSQSKEDRGQEDQE